MTKLSSEQEDIELFIEDYTNQIRMMSKLTDVEIKIVIRKLIEESPEWFDTLMNRYRQKKFTKMMKEVVRDVVKDPVGYVRKVA